MSSSKVSKESVTVDSALASFIENDVLEGLDLDPNRFWSNFEQFLKEYSLLANQFLKTRDDIQSRIDQWHIDHKGRPHDQEEYESFLVDIGYILPRPDSVSVNTSNVDPEIANIAAPQLVVPIDNARYALNAANARWGSLYDALYGTDVISEDDGATRDGPYNPRRGEKVIAYSKGLLDEHFPLTSVSHTESIKYSIVTGELSVDTPEGKQLLADPSQFVGHVGDADNPSSIFLAKNNLQIEIVIDPEHEIGSADPANIADVMVESAVSTIMDCEDSVATVDADDKVLAYSNWLGLMKGTLETSFAKGTETVTRKLTPDTAITLANGKQGNIRRRSLLLVRNVGMHISTEMVTVQGEPIPETLIDAVVTTMCGMHDLLNNGETTNSPSGSIYIVKPKMHGSQEVAMANQMFSAIESMLGLSPNTVKIGIMDEERRTSLNLLACIEAASERVVFINTGFLDRTGDEIHTSMEAGPVIPKTEMKSQQWLIAYEDINVDEGLEAGLLGHGQIGKGMWARPDDMADMLKEKVSQPLSGASCAWVPSPTAATLHALHYLDVNVGDVQASLTDRELTRREIMLKIPTLETGRELSPQEIDSELRNNAQGILGYVSRWVGQGVGCSKVPDINNVQLMEDRATLRISSQHIANWLHHGIVTEEQIHRVMEEMAKLVDDQNSDDKEYHPMSGDLVNSISYQAALALIFEGRNQANGYTEFLLTERRQRMKSSLS
ncbi:MAG: malate synthase G [Acidimicrobiales bacterium]